MSYCSQTDLIARFGRDELVQLTDRDGIGDIDAVVLDRAIADADAEIDAQLHARYTVPITPVPAVLIAKVCDLVRYYLHDKVTTELVAQRYHDAMVWLGQVRDGKIDLGVASPGPVATGARVVSKTGASDHDWDAY